MREDYNYFYSENQKINKSYLIEANVFNIIAIYLVFDNKNMWLQILFSYGVTDYGFWNNLQHPFVHHFMFLICLLLSDLILSKVHHLILH